jgi:prepilin-type processing-associated H-X9-DG protein
MVVLAIVGLLIAMLLPAIQKVREAQRRMECAAKLKQLGLAAHHFESDHQLLPPGYLGPDPAQNANMPAHTSSGQWVGHLPLLLPYLEQDVVARSIQVNWSPSVVTNDPWFRLSRTGNPNRANYSAAAAKLKEFVCPSASRFTPQFGSFGFGGGTLIGLHVFNSHSVGVVTDGWKCDYVGIAEYYPLGRTTYLGVAGCGTGNHPIFGQYAGVYTNRSSISLVQISVQDGTSNTLLYGEDCGDHWESLPETKDICWMAGGGLGTYLGLQRGSQALTIAFSSYHPGGVQFCFADGSVHLLRFGDSVWRQVPPFQSDWVLLQRLAGWKDGSPADRSALVE